MMQQIWKYGLAFCLAVWLWGCPQPAAAGLISTDAEARMGAEVAKQLEKEIGLVEDEAMQARIAAIGQRLAAVSERKDVKYQFKVLKADEVNALAAPGGYIYVFKGLVDLMPSDDELAGVIGHEVGHVVKRHTVKQMEKSLGLTLLMAIALGDKGLPLQSAAYQALMAGYSRDDEREADRLGFIYAFQAGFNPYSMTMGLTKLAQLSKNYQTDLFSDHPDSKARVALVQKELDARHVKPYVRELPGETAAVVDGSWQLQPFRAECDGQAPLFRAYQAAGNLYRASLQAGYVPERYILDSDGSRITIYYEEIAILTVTPQDALVYQMSVLDLANAYVRQLKEWQPQITGPQALRLRPQTV